MFDNLDIKMDLVSKEQEDKDLVMSKVVLKSRPLIRTQEEIKCMYSECFACIVDFKHLKCHIELELKFHP